MLFILLVFFQLNAVASTENLGKTIELFKVEAVKIEGTHKVEPEAVLEKMTIKAGVKLDNYLLRDDIKRIYSLKYFEKVEAHQEGNTLIIKVQEKPIISKIIIEGNDEISDEDITEQMKTKPFAILDVNTLKADMTLIQNFYEEKGYFLAQAKYALESHTAGSVVVKVIMKEYDQVLVKKITFLGNDALDDDALKKVMQTQEEGLFSFMTSAGNFKEFNFQADIERMKYLYKSEGYLQVNVGTPSITVSEDKKWIFITVNITEGPKFSINNIFFEGELIFSESELRDVVTLKHNDIYSEDKLRLDIQALTEKYQDEGYAFANVLRTIEIVPGENKVDIHFSFEKGKIAYFGNIYVKGNVKTRDKVIRRELRIHEGMKFSGSLLRKSRDNVNRLGFFEPGSVVFNTITPKGKDNVLDVEIQIKERQTGQISIGAGYSTATKGFFQASIAQNNFRGLGQNLNFSLSLAANQKLFNLGFTEPYLNDTKWTAGFDLFKTTNRNIRAFEYDRFGGDVRMGYPLVDYLRLFVTYKWERTEITSETIPDPAIIPSEVNGIASSVTTSVIWDKRNNIFEPTDGHYVSSSLEYTGIAGDLRWIKSEAEGRFYEPIWGDLTLRTRLNVSKLFRNGKNIPRTEKFSMGGARNMRGYYLEEIGPRRFEPLALPAPGQYFNNGGLFSLLSQIELEYPLVKEAGLKAVIFYDIGNVYDQYFGADAESHRLYFDYGFGFRWFSPIGVLRFEFAYPVNDVLGGVGGNQFHFDIGQLF
ncbi:MAG: outer membrane protein assembly factor BamA [Bacteriovoracaceae bacterium]|nr:outer membrane protein assembly factor BamA [Bacteriovoracaceae bacterium]